MNVTAGHATCARSGAYLTGGHLYSGRLGPRPLVVSVAQLVARWTHDRESNATADNATAHVVVGSIPASAVCFTVVR